MQFTTISLPKSGDTRIRKVFAFLPTKVTDTTTVWLETYFVAEKYCYDRLGYNSGWITSYYCLNNPGSV